MLVQCPECSKQVSDRAAACPDCGFPIAQHVAEQKAVADAAADRASRKVVGEVDCPHCQARGFIGGRSSRDSSFSWCTACEHSGRCPLVRSSAGYWAVAFDFVDAFVAGADATPERAVSLGGDPPAGHRYAKASPRKTDE